MRLPVALLAAVIAAGAIWMPASANNGVTSVDRSVVNGRDAMLSARAHGIALGIAMIGPGIATYDAFTASSGGRPPAIWAIGGEWGGSHKAFPDTALLDHVWANGTVPMISWEPEDSAHPDNPAYRYARIARGKFDPYLREWATAARDWGGPIVLRFAYEMNGYWFSWGIGRYDNTPARFVAAWRHIWNIFKGPGGVGATNVKFLWAPNEPSPGAASIRSVFPGRKYIDFAGFSAYNWAGLGGRRWRTMVEAFAPSIKAIAKLTRKPILVAETGAHSRGGDKVAWVRKGYPAVYRKWPQVRGIVYLNARLNGRDWRLTSPPEVMDAYRAIVADKRFWGEVQ